MKLLFVEDERLVRESVANQIRKLFSVEVITASHGGEGIELFKRHLPEIVLTDIKMPVCDGLEMIKQIREISKDVVITIITAYADFEYAKSALQYQVHDFLIKPVTMKMIKTTMEELISLANIQAKSLEQKSYDQLNNILHGLIPPDMEFSRKPVILLGYKLLDFQLKSGFSLVDSNLIFYSVQNILEELFPKAENLFSWYLMKETHKTFYLLFLLSSTPSMRKLNELEQKIRMRCSQLENIFSKKLFLEVACAVRGPFSGENIYAQYLDINKELEHRFPEVQFLVKVDHTAFYQGRRICELIKKKDFPQLADAVKELLEEYSDLFDVENAVTHLIYYLFVAFEDELEFREISFRKFSSLFPKWDYAASKEDVIRELLMGLEKISTLLDSYHPRTIHPIIYQIEQDIRSDYSSIKLLKDYAEKYHININYLSELFAKELGKTFSDFITEIKIKEAKKRLKDPSVKVCEVALCLGYSDGRYFSQLFKRCTGMSPKEYKNIFAKI